MIKKISSNVKRIKRHQRVRKNISGTAERPRLNVYRSLNHIYAQIIDDTKGTTLVSASSLDKDFEGYGGNIEGAKQVGNLVAKKALDKKLGARGLRSIIEEFMLDIMYEIPKDENIGQVIVKH